MSGSRPGPAPLPANVVAISSGHQSKAEIERRRASEVAVPPAERLSRPPAWLSRSAADLWRRHVPVMVQETPGLIADRDVMALGLLFEHVAAAKAAAKACATARGGYTEVLDIDQAHAGRRRKAPALEVLKTQSAAALSLMREFGMTPSSRVGLRLGAMIEPDDDVDDDAGIFDA